MTKVTRLAPGAQASEGAPAPMTAEAAVAAYSSGVPLRLAKGELPAFMQLLAEAFALDPQDYARLQGRIKAGSFAVAGMSTAELSRQIAMELPKVKAAAVRSSDRAMGKIIDGKTVRDSGTLAFKAFQYGHYPIVLTPEQIPDFIQAFRQELMYPETAFETLAKAIGNGTLTVRDTSADQVESKLLAPLREYAGGIGDKRRAYYQELTRKFIASL